MESCRIKKSNALRRVQLPLYASSLFIPLDEVAVLFRCGKCLTSPIKPPVYNCRSGHLTCVGCYRLQNRDCFKCKEPLMGRNELVEEVLRGLSMNVCNALNDCSMPLRESRSEQSLQLNLEDHLEKLERARLEAEQAAEMTSSSETSLKTLIHQRASHKPVMCPYPCGRIVTCSGLFPHFEFHHPKVLISTVDLDVSTLIDLRYQDVVQQESRCHVFFVVRLDKNNPDSNKLTAANLLKMTRSSQEMLSRGCFISTLSVGRMANPLANHASGDDAWFLTIWGTCLYECSPISYTLSASNVHSPHTVSFTGPLVSLYESQRPEDVYSRGECLLIPPGVLREMSYILQVAVTFHSLSFTGRVHDIIPFDL